jgi:hypothetical protein
MYPHGSTSKFFLVGDSDTPVYMPSPDARPLFLQHGTWKPYPDIARFFSESTAVTEGEFRAALRERGQGEEIELPDQAGPVRYAKFDPSKHPRETKAHDGKKAGEFAIYRGEGDTEVDALNLRSEWRSVLVLPAGEVPYLETKKC